MAESIIIHFSEPDSSEIARRIEGWCGPGTGHGWCYPEDDYLILVSSYGGFEEEYNESEREAVCSRLGSYPTASFDFEIRRSRSDEACDALERFVRRDLQGLNFVVDDNMWRILSRADLDECGDFLDCYRYNKQGVLMTKPLDRE